MKLFITCIFGLLPWLSFAQVFTGVPASNTRNTVQQAKKRVDGGFQLQVMSQIDQPFTVQTSTNLVNWLDFTNVICTNVPMDVIDAGPVQGRKFYRAYTQ
jgi:hypothetical protein